MHGGRPGNEARSVIISNIINEFFSNNEIDPALYIFVNGGELSHYNSKEKDSYGEDVFIKHYEVGELADSAEKNISEAKEVSAGYSPPKELHHFHKMLLRLRDIEAIVIAGINGNTAGGGCEFSLGCDLRIMSEGPYAIGLPETSVGILPGGGGTQRLARLIGSSRALDLILHARLLSPQEAFEFGLINKLVPHERFREELMAYCSDLASRAPIALRQV